jgi:polyphosphate kinase 2 (PPK2 family)
MRAYGEINAFEEELAEHGHLIVKFWLAISKEEQLRRFEERQGTPFKQHKITDEDWRNREKWDAYNLAIGDMLDRTSTATARWTWSSGGKPMAGSRSSNHARRSNQAGLG